MTLQDWLPAIQAQPTGQTAMQPLSGQYGFSPQKQQKIDSLKPLYEMGVDRKILDKQLLTILLEDDEDPNAVLGRAEMFAKVNDLDRYENEMKKYEQMTGFVPQTPTLEGDILKSKREKRLDELYNPDEKTGILMDKTGDSYTKHSTEYNFLKNNPNVMPEEIGSKYFYDSQNPAYREPNMSSLPTDYSFMAGNPFNPLDVISKGYNNLFNPTVYTPEQQFILQKAKKNPFSSFKSLTAQYAI